MSQCMKALREFFENCKVFLYTNDDDGIRIYCPKPFDLKVVWTFDEALCLHGYGLMDDSGYVIISNEFSGGCPVNTICGDTLECRFDKIKLGPYEIGKIFDKVKKRRLRKLSDARVERMKKIYEKYGKINGWGIEFNKNHEDAIAVYFETAHDINNAPKYFESWPVVCHVLGPIKLEKKKKEKK